MPIPVTVKLDNIKVIRREKEETGESGEETGESENIKKEESDEELKINKSYDEPSGGLIPDDY